MSGNEILLTLIQALQLVGLVPCLFIALMLPVFARHNRQVIAPAAYFLSLACAFALPLLDIFLPALSSITLTATLLLGRNLLPALAFFMILQFMQLRVPKWLYVT
jgi:predicted branched-subunit amino acid permease